jgi:Calx-beta domain-containing protein
VHRVTRHGVASVAGSGAVLITLLAIALAVPSATAAGPLTAETPRISGGGEASGQPPATEEIPTGAHSAPVRPQRRPSPHGAVGPTFEGMGYDDNFTENGFRTVPPDPIGAAGPDRLIAMVNSMIEARNKTGGLLYRDALKDFYAPLAGCAILSFPFDPKIVYDHHAGRFVVVALERANAGVNPSAGNLSRILVAVSKTSSPATATAADWWFHCIDSKIDVGGIEYWADYPGCEVDEDAIYITNNMFSFPGVTGTYAGSRLWIVRKGVAGGLYSGGPATVTVHNPYTLPFSLATTTMPALVHGAGGVAPGVGTFLVSYSGITDGTSEYVQVVRVDDPLGAVGGPFFVGPDFVDIGDLETLAAELPDAPQPGTGQLIEVNDRRALDAVWRSGALWLVTTVNPNGASQPALADHTTAWWIALNTSAVTGSGSPAGLLTLSNQGGIAGEEIAGLAGGEVYTYFPSVALNGSGTAAFGFAACGINVYAGAYATVRRASDPIGVTDPASAVEPGRDHYVRTFDAPPCDAAPARNRWGDYSGISVDPANDNAFWVFNQFADFRGSPGTGGCNGRPDPEDGRWGTAWGIVGLSPSIAIGNASVAEGNTGAAHTLIFTVLVSGPTIADITVDLTTVDGTAVSSVGDYVATTTSLTIPVGAPSGTFPVTVNGDVYPESNETLTVTMSNPVNATITPGGGNGVILNDDGTTAVGEPAVVELGLRALTPNPGAGPARLEFALPEAAGIDLSVIDVQGHRVAQLASGPHPAGRHTAVWNVGEGARRVPAGIYFVRLATPAGHRLRRLVIL